MEEDSQIEYYPCPECQAGVLHHAFMVYFTWLSGELITVPDFPAWVCDMCGMREYDAQAVARLNILLNPNTGRSSQAARRMQRPPDASPTQPTQR